MRAVLVAVDFADILAVTLPYNRHHFDEVMVVTTPTDTAVHEVADQSNARVFTTNAFYDDDAVFNKWKALEQGLDVFGRNGWLCLMDADVLWPKQLPEFERSIGTLYTPRRRMMKEIVLPIPSEQKWLDYPQHPQQVEWAGYSQIFHCDDPHLGASPWHETNWRHAGGADSFFQFKWPNDCKVRPPFEVLHLGEAGRNWCGRAVDYLDGTTPEGASDKKRQVQGFIRSRRGRKGPTRFDNEKTTPPPS